MQATNGSLSEIRTHMKGLQKLVELRGGLDDPNMNPYTRRLVLWWVLKSMINFEADMLLQG